MLVVGVTRVRIMAKLIINPQLSTTTSLTCTEDRGSQQSQ
jgi:hypothetical protein